MAEASEVKIPRRILNTLLSSLSAGVVPRSGAPYIAIGRGEEIGSLLNNLEEVKIIHGKGLKILSTAIHDALRRNKRVESYRFGKYGEGERGVTFVKLK